MYSLTLACIALLSCTTVLQVVHGAGLEQLKDAPNYSEDNINEIAANFFEDNDNNGDDTLEKKTQEFEPQPDTQQDIKEETTDFEKDLYNEVTAEEDNSNEMEDLNVEQEDDDEINHESNDDSNQNEVPIDLNEEPVELKEDDLSSEGFSAADEEVDKATSKVSFQALIKSQSQKCTCYCKQGGERSCDEIRKNRPNSYSGYYTLLNSNDKEVRVFCRMGRMCGIDGGWQKVVDLDMKRAEARCPPALQEYKTGRIRHCGRKSTRRGSCASVGLCARGIKYSQVCGRVIGYQYFNTDGGHAYSYRSKNINGPYIDGISITRGSRRRQHIWSYISALSETRRADCPCFSRRGAPRLASFIGNNYYCESGFRSQWYRRWATTDPLWDGKQCNGYEKKCCADKRMPWFYRNLGRARADKLEVRSCGDEKTTSENVSIREMELYVR